MDFPESGDNSLMKCDISRQERRRGGGRVICGDYVRSGRWGTL